MSNNIIDGYAYGSNQLMQSPVSVVDISLLQKTLLFGEEDEKYLKLAGEVLQDQIDSILDLWYGFVGSNSHLLYYFTNKQEQPIDNYLSAVRARFGQWILDLCNRKYDQEWLNYQHEIGLRHHKSKKNKTDNVDSVSFIPYRYMVAFIYPITATIKTFLAKKGHSTDDVEKMHQAWFKAVVLTTILWTYPYIKDGEF